MFGEGPLEFGARLGGIFEGVQKHLPIDIVQRKSLVLLDYLVGCMQRLAEHEFRQTLVCIGGSTLQFPLGEWIEADVHALLLDGF